MSTGNGSKTLRRYEVRDDKGRWLARVVISDDGYFSTVGEYGNYAYWWGSAGMEFRAFLCSVEPDYLCGKLARQDEYDGEATERAVKRSICEMRRRMSLTKRDARAEWARLDDFDNLGSRECFAMWYQDTELGDASEYSVWRYTLDVTAFAEKVWPSLRKALKEEMDAEKVEALP